VKKGSASQLDLQKLSSTGVSQLKKTDTDWEITPAGKLNLHGVEKPLTLPLRVHLEGDRFDAKGETYVSQTEFGMTRIKIAGGAVKVRDRVKISFAIVAKRSNL
jgi:polyisoprenoid-binding protein YceI